MGKKRISEITGKLFKLGDIREDGYIFQNYYTKELASGFFQEKWSSPDSHLRYRMSKIIRDSKRTHRRGADLPKENNLTIEYLLKILPEDRLCPALGIWMDWGGNKTIEKDTSPSLDRIDPDVGYIIGNVQFVSTKVNRVKSNQKMDRLVELGNWAQRVIDEGIDHVYE